MEPVYSNLISDNQLYSVVIQKKNTQGIWEDIILGGNSENGKAIFGKNISAVYPPIRMDFISVFLRNFRFNLMPYRIAIFCGFEHLKASNAPIIAEYSDKTLVRFALSIPDFWKEFQDLTDVIQSLQQIRNSRDPLYRHPYHGFQTEKKVDSAMIKLDDIIHEISDDELTKSWSDAEHQFDVYFQNFLKLYDQGGIFKTKFDEEKSKRKKSQK